MKIIDFLYGQNLVWSNMNPKCTSEIFLLALRHKIENLIRGGVKIEKQENFGPCPKTENRKKQKCPNFNFGILKKEGGDLYFSKMSQSQLFDSVVCNIAFVQMNSFN